MMQSNTKPIPEAQECIPFSLLLNKPGQRHIYIKFQKVSCLNMRRSESKNNLQD